MQFRHYSSAVFILFFWLSASGQSVRPASSRQSLGQSFAALPMGFEQNQGQADRDVLYLSRAPGYSVYLLRSKLLVVFDSRDKAQGNAEIVDIAFAGAHKGAEPQGNDLLPGATNYYIGNDPAKWRTNVRQFREVRYSGIYPGVDLIFYSNRGHLEFDFNVAPGADVSRVALRVNGALLRRSRGNLEVVTPAGRTAVLKQPDFYQVVGHTKHKVAGGYAMRGANEVAFSVGPYDKRQTLVIDPALIYSTLGGSPNLTPFAIAVDSSGAAYVTGQASSAPGAAFVAKFDPTGSSLVYRTLLGGTKVGLGPVSDGSTIAAGQTIAVDGNGNAYFAGTTLQIDFPTTPGVFSTSNFCATTSGAASCLEPFAAKLDSNGKLVYSTFLAVSSKSDNAGPVPSSIAVDGNGALYVTGTTAKQDGGTVGPLAVAGLTPTQGAFQTSRKNDSSAFVLKLHPDGSTLDYSTYLGGSTGETAGGIAVDTSGIAYIDGGTSSTDFPVTPGASLTTNPGTAAFFTKLKADGSGVLYSTFLAGPNGLSEGTSIAIDSSHAAYLTGMTAASFPTKMFGAISLPAFAAKFDSSGTLVYSTLVGTQMTYGLDLFSGAPPQSSIAADPAGNAYVASGSGGFDTSTIVESKLDSMGNVVYTLGIGPIAPRGSTFGGVALDSNQNFYVTGGAGQLFDPATPPGPTAITIPDIGTTVGAFDMVPTSELDFMFIQKFAQSLGAAVPVPNPRVISFSPILQKGVTSGPRTIQLFNYGDSALSISSFSIGGVNSSDFAISPSNNTCGATVAASTSCSFRVTFSPTVAFGNRSATVNLSFGGGLAAQTVALNGVAGTPAFQASPNPVNFGDVAVGATSGINNLTISNAGTGPMNILSTPVIQGNNPADFSICVLAFGHCALPFVWPAFIPPGGSLTVPLVVTPTATGPRSAQLVLNTDAAGSPQMASLQGNGVLLGVSAGASSVAVNAGQTATYFLTVTSAPSLSGAATVTCTGAPAGASCNPSPNSFTFSSGSPQTVTVTVPTTPRSSSSLIPARPGVWWSLAAAFGIVLLRPRRRRLRGMLIMAGTLMLLGAMISCGGGGAPPGGGGGGTPPGTYTLTVTVAGSGATRSLPLTLTVQ